VLVAVVTCLAAILVVPEFRKFIGLETSVPQVEKPSEKETNVRKAAEGSAYAVNANGIPEDAFKKLQEMARAKIHIRSVAFSPEGGYVIISDPKQWWRGISEVASDMMREVTEPIKQITFTPNNGWIILYGKNGWKSRGLSQSTLNSLNKLYAEGRSIDMVSFTPDGGWVIVYDNYGAYWEGIPKGLDKKLRGMNANNRIDVIAFTPTGGWLLVHNGAAWSSNDVPDLVTEKLDELTGANKSIDVVSFTHDGGWVIIAGSK
jgi:hypothetical protein